MQMDRGRGALERWVGLDQWGGLEKGGGKAQVSCSVSTCRWDRW